MHIYNDQNLIIKYYKNFTQIKDLITNKVLLSYKKVYLCLSLKNSHKKVILNLNNMFFFFYNPFNLISFDFFNIYKIFYNNKNKIFLIKN